MEDQVQTEQVSELPSDPLVEPSRDLSWSIAAFGFGLLTPSIVMLRVAETPGYWALSSWGALGLFLGWMITAYGLGLVRARWQPGATVTLVGILGLIFGPITYLGIVTLASYYWSRTGISTLTAIPTLIATIVFATQAFRSQRIGRGGYVLAIAALIVPICVIVTLLADLLIKPYYGMK
ncbi:MAG: hypothetical protein LBE83_06740 [Propionibacteriaceae bacterium]|jgi:hypothetical protein|nr:hypothetical protein [Propionibacteriaceae bacterium]